MQFSLPQVLLLFVVFQMGFCAFLLFTQQKRNNWSSRLLGLFFLALGLNLADSFLLLQEVYLHSPGWALWGSALPLLYGPLLFGYVASIVRPQFTLWPKAWLHLIPFLLLWAASSVSYWTLPREIKVELLQTLTTQRSPLPVLVVGVLVYVHIFAYLIASLRMVKLYRKAALNLFSDVESATASWLYKLLLFFTLLVLLGAVNSAFANTEWFAAKTAVLLLILLLLLAFISRILLRILRTPALFFGADDLEPQPQTEPANIPKYVGSPFSAADKQSALQAVQQHMAGHKPFLEPELTLEDLARQVGIKPKLLSQSINELKQQNFFEFVNEYRLREAKQMLAHPPDPKITVSEVMYEVGFNSKSSFNTLFKKHTGLTPSEFKRVHKSESVRPSNGPRSERNK